MKEKKMKIVIFSAVFLLLFAGSVFGAYVLSLQSNSITGHISSIEGGTMTLGVFDNFEDIDATNIHNDLVKETIANITNNNGNVSMLFTTIETITDVNDSCNNTGDVSIKYYFDNVEVNNSEVIVINGGDTEIKITQTAIPRSCDQTTELEFFLAEV